MLQIITYLLCVYLVFKAFEIFQVALIAPTSTGRNYGIALGVLSIVVAIVTALAFSTWIDRQAAIMSIK